MWRTTDSGIGDGFLVGEEVFFCAGDLELTFLGEEALLGGGERPLFLFGLFRWEGGERLRELLLEGEEDEEE
jgi:hypothetical protein